MRARLAVTLRFLATGDAYTNLQYLFKISKTMTSEIIPAVYDTLIEAFQEYIKVRMITHILKQYFEICIFSICK